MPRKWLPGASAVLLSLGIAVLVGVWPATATPNPPGNNGTIKIDDVLFDDHPHNEPHVGCVFQVDFYGFDKGDLHAQVTFEARPPTLRSGDDQTLLTDTVFIGEDDNSGGGSEAGLDASVTYTLDLSGITPHPQQGVHVKLTINAEGSQGADTKHKVFWVTGCGPTPTPSETPTVEPTETPTETPSETPTEKPTETASPTHTPTAPPTPVETHTAAPVVSPAPTPGGEEAASATLPLTGTSAVVGLVGLAILAAGVGLVIAGRRTTDS